jgi:hypothetical protein
MARQRQLAANQLRAISDKHELSGQPKSLDPQAEQEKHSPE